MLDLVDLIYRKEQKIIKWIPESYDLETPPSEWAHWLRRLFPNLFYHPFITRHKEFWRHIESIEPDIKPPAFFAVWPRGSGKSTNMEAAAIRLGANKQRKFVLYTRSVQDKANESVANIAAMLESNRVGRYYPELTERKLGKYGNSKGWKVNVLRTASGFNVAALGYDAAVRGIKFEEFRPDLIIIDDIDDKDDTYSAIQKKIKTLTRDILPAGSSDCAVIGIQNLVNFQGIFTQIVQNKADFLRNRIISGPYVAVKDLEYSLINGKYKITKGKATWEGQNIQTCEAQINEWGLSAFLEEAQNEIRKKEGRVYHAFTDPGPLSTDLDSSKIEGYYHSHDFGAVNHVFGLWAKIGNQYFLVHSERLPEGTTPARAERIKKVFGDKRIVAGYGGALSERQIRADYAAQGVIIQAPPMVGTQLHLVDSQVRITNEMFEKDELVICADMLEVIDHLENCIRDDKEQIADKSIWHYADMCRYFAVGIKRKGWSR